MFEEKKEKELVRVQVRRLPLEEKKAVELGTELPTDHQDDWQMPRRWKLY